jgi:hypothetical protein
MAYERSLPAVEKTTYFWDMTLDPSVCWGGPVAAGVAGIYRPSGFHEHGTAFTLCRGFVFCSLRDDEHLPFLDGHIAIPEVNGHFPVQYDEHLIGVFVVMPNKLPLELDQLEVIVVHLGDDLRGPVLRELRELLGEVDCGHHVPLFFNVGK